MSLSSCNIFKLELFLQRVFGVVTKSVEAKQVFFII